MRNKILLVEDSKVVQHMYRSKLTLEQFTVITADNGMEAIKLLSQEIPDLILLDLMRPVIDGYKVLQVIKTDPRLAGIPVLLFSARGQAEEVEKALNLGAAGYIVKATTKPNEVVEQIKKVLSQRPQGKGTYTLYRRNQPRGPRCKKTPSGLQSERPEVSEMRLDFAPRINP